MAKHKESRFGYVVLCSHAIYGLMSFAIAMKDDGSACGGPDSQRHWSYVPPAWICD